MKILNISAITSTNGLPVKSGTLKFLQDSFKECFFDTFRALKENGYSSSVAYVLWGCNSSISGGNTIISEGAIFFNGEIYHSPAQTITTPTSGNVIVANIDTTQYNINADPVTMTLGGTVNVHDIRQVKYSSGASGSGNISNYSSFVHYGAWMQNNGTIIAYNGVYSWTVYINRYIVIGKTVSISLYLKFDSISSGGVYTININIPFRIKGCTDIDSSYYGGVAGYTANIIPSNNRTLVFGVGFDIVGNPTPGAINFGKIDGTNFSAGEYVRANLTLEIE